MVADINRMAREIESERPVVGAVRTTCSKGLCPDFEEPDCAVRAPGPDMSIDPPLSPFEYQRLVDVVGQGQNPPIIRIEEWSPDDAPDRPTAGADRVLIVTTWGGYNRCLHFGKNLGFVVERVGGTWRRVGKGARFVEYMR